MSLDLKTCDCGEPTDRFSGQCAMCETDEGLFEQPTHPEQTKQPVADERDSVESQILDRYSVHPTGRGFWPYCVRAGDGQRELYVGHKKKCNEVAAELRNACLDGAFMTRAALSPAEQPGRVVAWRITGAGGLTVTPEYPKWAESDERLKIEALVLASAQQQKGVES